MRLPTLTYPRARALGARFVDLRSPGEFAHDHVPGARNVPLFGDQQRAVVGAVYRQVSPAEARARGGEFAAARMPELLCEMLGCPVPEALWRRHFTAIAGEVVAGADLEMELRPAQVGELGAQPLVVSCWRGGMRSRSIIALLRALGHENVALLEGGYKSYRMWVRRRVAAFHPTTALIVLRGPTGIGKTRLLHELEFVAPGSTLDLEAMARHRSSILGDVGLNPASTMAFESALADRLDRLGPQPWFVEGESRRVGDVVLPEPLFQAMEDGVQVRLEASIDYRIEVLLQDYAADPSARAQLAERLPFLESRLGGEWCGRLRAWLRAGRLAKVARTLLERYYDPRYAHCDRRRAWTARLKADDPEVIPQLLQLRAHSLNPCAASSALLA